jgi:hypothetical protein
MERREKIIRISAAVKSSRIPGRGIELWLEYPRGSSSGARVGGGIKFGLDTLGVSSFSGETQRHLFPKL